MINPPNHFIMFDGQNLADWGLHISGDKTFGAPERDVDEVEVPGRNGTLTYDNGRFKNYDLEYEGGIVSDDTVDFEYKIRRLRSFLCSRYGYKRLEDTYHPDEFRLAKFVDGLDPDVTQLQGATFDLKFDCKPQRFLKSGEEAIVMTASGSIFNFTYFETKPLIRCYGSGKFLVNRLAVTVTKPNTVPYVIIDSDIEDCYYDTTNLNSSVSLSTGDFPVLKPGATEIGLEEGITKLEIVPRWYTI